MGTAVMSRVSGIGAVSDNCHCRRPASASGGTRTDCGPQVRDAGVRARGTAIARGRRLMPSPSRAAALAVLALGAGAAAQQVWIVNPQAGVNALQAMIDDIRVQSGDILRVQGGTYGPTTLTTKALHIVAEGTVEVQQLVIQGIPARTTVSLLGVNITGIPGTGAATPSLWVRQCAGGVMVDSCGFQGRQEAPSQAAQVRAVVQVEQASLFAEWSRLSGTAAGASTLLPASALWASQATVTLSLCTVVGGRALLSSAQDGMPAVQASNALIYLEHNLIMGGSGGNPGNITCPGNPGGLGGAAVDSVNSDVLVTGAEQLWAGFSPTPVCGQPTSAIAGTGNLYMHPSAFLMPNPGAPAVDPRMVVYNRNPVALVPQQSSLLPGQNARWDHYGDPGSFVFTLLSQLAWTTVPHPQIPGGLHVDPGLAILTGPILVPPGGSVPIQFVIPNSPALRGARLFVATVGVDASFINVLATPPSALFVRFL